MFVSHSLTYGRPRLSPAVLVPVLLAAFFGACGGSSGVGGQSGVPGEETLKPGGGSFFVDVNQSGGATTFLLDEVVWGRLVDVYEVDGAGQRVETPVFNDFVIEPAFPDSSYVLDRNPATQRERLTIRARKTGVADSADFDRLLREISDDLPVVSVKNDDGSSSPSFTTVPRNACVVMRFNDCLDDDEDARINLTENVLVYVGYPPVNPFSARVVFDPNHGAVIGRSFHSTRVLVDMTTSEFEASPAVSPVALDVNAIGLPPRQASSNETNVSIRIPSRTDVGSAQVQVLRNLNQAALELNSNGPVDLSSPTRDIVRAIRSGFSDDPSNGFLSDLTPPHVVAGWGINVSAATPDPADPQFAFVVSFSFTTTCQAPPAPGDVIQVGGVFLEVKASATPMGSVVTGLAVRSATAVADPDILLQAGLYQATFLPSLIPTSPPATLDEVAQAKQCWVSFLPEATTPPATGVASTSQILIRFSEPMDPATLSPFGGLLVVKGVAGSTTTAKPSNIVLGRVRPNADLTVFTFEPRAPMPHTQGVADPLHIELSSVKDLAGNALPHVFPFIDFTLDPPEASRRNASLALRFDSIDEYGPSGGGPDGLDDIRGQFFPSNRRSAIQARPVAVTGWPVDRNNPVPSRMLAVGGGLALPLSPQGCKQQMLWRYCDMAWIVTDETKYNMDVIGLNWSPIGGQVQADFYNQFEIRLGHSRFLPDETRANSGLPGSTGLFEDNYLAGSNPRVVHNRALGYTVNPANLFSASDGVPMVPFPLNRGLSPDVTYTWRDTSILTLAGGGDSTQRGIPLDAEAGAGVVAANQVGRVAAGGVVPSFGLPLLIEIRCHPADQGLGLNRFDVSVGNGAATFRAYSAGGFNNFGNPVTILPDTETFPKGGFNPFSIPAGARTPAADNVFYLGQLDTVVRISRVHTAWLDSGVLGALWREAVLEPDAQPSGTGVVLDFRGVTGFGGTGTLPFDASQIDPYGNEVLVQGMAGPMPPQNPLVEETPWSGNIASIVRRYIQVRLTFSNNIATEVSPEITALGLAYDLP